MRKQKTVGAKRTSGVLKQLNDWVQSETVLRLIVSAEAFSVFHTGCLQKLPGDNDVFYLEPSEGGGTFEFSPSDCRATSHREDDWTAVSFSKGKSIVLKLLEAPWRAAAPEVTNAPDEASQSR
jgi:hypothetical protein